MPDEDRLYAAPRRADEVIAQTLKLSADCPDMSWSRRFRASSTGRASPRQADILIVSGTVTVKMAYAIRRVYDQMADPKYVIAMGVCATSGGPYQGSYTTVPGVDNFLPVDVYVAAVRHDRMRSCTPSSSSRRRSLPAKLTRATIAGAPGSRAIACIATSDEIACSMPEERI